MSMSEIQEAAEVITGAVSPDANIIFGASIRPELEDEIVITVVATGSDSDYYRDMERGVTNNARASVEPETEQVATDKEEDSVVTEGGASVDLKDLGEKKPTVSSEDFTKETPENMWDSIRSEADEEEDDLDVPPSLRARLRRKAK